MMTSSYIVVPPALYDTMTCGLLVVSYSSVGRNYHNFAQNKMSTPFAKLCGCEVQPHTCINDQHDIALRFVYNPFVCKFTIAKRS